MSSDQRLPVRRTAKLYLGGQFPRSESGRTYEVVSADGRFLAHAARASRKDLRDAVVAARGAFAGWAARTAYNRGQILYRVAEIMEGRRAQLEDEVRDSGAADPADEVSRAIDRWVWYAGWADKIAQVAGSANPVAGPYFNFTVPEPTGVVGIVAPAEPSLLGLVSRIAPVIVSGNVVVAVASERSPLPAVSLAEALATSDVPGGVINILTGIPGRARPVARSSHGCERDRPHGLSSTTSSPRPSARLPTTSSGSIAPDRLSSIFPRSRHSSSSRRSGTR